MKKTGPDAAGWMEPCFPGEGARSQPRVGVRGPTVAIGEAYARGAATLQSSNSVPQPGRRAIERATMARPLRLSLMRSMCVRRAGRSASVIAPAPEILRVVRIERDGRCMTVSR